MVPRALQLVVVVATAAAAALVLGVARGDFAADRAECSDKLVGLATCLTYVQEQAAASAPTPDCCAGLKTVLQTSRKCLCVLIKDRNDPNLGLKINVTRALGLPAVCKAQADISDCPKLLNLAPNSAEAQVFEQYAKQVAAQGGGGTSTPGASAAGGAAAAAQKSGAGPAARWLGVGGSGSRVVIGDGGARATVLAALAAAPLLLLLAC